MNDRQPMLDAFLAERLRGESPPDLSARILAAAKARRLARSSSSGGLAANGVPLVAPAVAADPSSKSHPIARPVSAPVVVPSPRAEAPRRSGVPAGWILATAAAALLVAVGSYWLAKPSGDRLAVRDERGPRTAGSNPSPSIAVRTGESPRVASSSGALLAPERATASADDMPPRVPGHTRPAAVSTSATGEESTPGPTVLVAPSEFVATTPNQASPAGSSGVSGPSPFASTEGAAEAAPGGPGAIGSSFASHVPANRSWNDDEIVARIDAEIERRWAEAGVAPSPRATDAEWCRRVFLDLLGRIPTVDEIREFTSDPRSDKRGRLVDEILFSERYTEPFVDHWTTIWTNLLIGRTGGMTADGVSRAGLQKWLRDSLARRVAYDDLVAALIAGEGVNAPGHDGFAGQVNFLLDNVRDEQVSATNKISQLFLGVRLNCTQCHNHPFNDWKQDHFWGLNAFFKQTRLERLGQDEDGPIVRLFDGDFASQLGDPTEAEIYYETRQGLLQVAYPTFLDGRKINPSGELAVVNRRDELAKLVVGSAWAKAAAVNRLWAHFLGFGLVNPIDDFGPHNPPSHPAVLSLLGESFAESGWDLRRAMKWIVMSRPYQLSSRIDPRNRIDLPEAGETPLFTRFYLRQMRAEALYESLVVATRMDRDLPRDFFSRQGRQQAWMQQFVIDFATDENDETVTFDGSITQTLMMMNGDLVAQATSVEPGSFLSAVANAPGGEREKISELYLAALGRQPTTQETQLAQQLWSARRGDVPGTLQDVWWALLNSNEFIMNH